MADVIPTDDSPEEVSLNAGAELDHELANAGPPHEELFGQFTPGEIPELKKDVALIEALEAQLQDLTYLRADLLRSRGMSQGIAVEAQRLLPGFDGAAPLGFYTVEPSSTRYQVALEEITKGMWVAIAALAAAVIAAITRLVQWLLNRHHGSNSDPSKTAKESETKLDEAVKRTEELSQLVKSGQAVTLNKQGEPDKLITLTSLIEDTWTDQTRYEGALKFLRLEDAMLRDIVFGGEYSKAAREVMHSLSAARSALQSKVQQLESVTRIDRSSFQESDRLGNAHMLEVLSKPLELLFQGQRLAMQDLADRMVLIRRNTYEHPSAQHHELTFDHMVKAVTGAYKAAELVKFFQEQAAAADVFKQLEATLQRIERSAGDLSKDGSVGHNSEGVASQIREVLRKVSQDVGGYNRLYLELMNYVDALNHLAMQAVGFANELEAQLFAMARRGQIKLPEGWTKKGNRDRIEKIGAIFGKPGK